MVNLQNVKWWEYKLLPEMKKVLKRHKIAKQSTKKHKQNTVRLLRRCRNKFESSTKLAPTSVYAFNLNPLEENTGTQFPFDVLHAKHPF